MDYSYKILIELERLEQFSNVYQSELRFLSKKIRNDIWKDGNDLMLASVLKALNNSLETQFPDRGVCGIGAVLSYADTLGKYGIFINPKLDTNYYEDLIDGIYLENAKAIIDKKWENINSSDDGSKTFMEIFGEMFTQCIEKRKEEFFYPLKKTDVLCRVVSDWGHDTDRFIPWPNKVQNRWNPPGRTYLYLSFAEKKQNYNSELSISEYVCLEEYRAVKGEKYSFCFFEALNEGNILDLSYNDINLGALRRMLDDYQNMLEVQIFTDIISDPIKVEQYKRNDKKLRKAIKQKSESMMDKSVIEDAVAKQYLKMVCSCIYKKVDEKDDDKREIAYKSFHILSDYLEKKGVTGIIYPCTRTNKIAGKNVVLFNIHDVAPMASTIREIVY